MKPCREDAHGPASAGIEQREGSRRGRLSPWVARGGVGPPAPRWRCRSRVPRPRARHDLYVCGYTVYEIFQEAIFSCTHRDMFRALSTFQTPQPVSTPHPAHSESSTTPTASVA